MKILSLNKFYFLYGGSDRYFFEINELLESRGHSVVPFAMQHPRNRPTSYEEYFVSQVDFWERGSIADKLSAAGRVLYSSEGRDKIRKLLEISKPDVAHIHSIYHQISPSVLPVIKEFGIPMIETLHDYKPICPTYRLVSGDEICERCKGGKFFNAALQRCNNGSLTASSLNMVEMYIHHSLGWYELPDLFHSPSRFLKDKMVEFGMPSEKFIHIPLFIDPDKHQPVSVEDPYFVYFGRLAPVKGVKTLLEAMTLLKDRGTKLIIAGEGPQRDELEAFCRMKNLTRVEFSGYLDAAELWPLVGKSLFTILPSEWYENLPYAVLEAMALGKPVIGSNIGGIPELIDHGETGLLFESKNSLQLAESIDLLLENRSLRLLMGKAAREKLVTLYGAQNHYLKFMDALEQIR